MTTVPREGLPNRTYLRFIVFGATGFGVGGAIALLLISVLILLPVSVLFGGASLGAIRGYLKGRRRPSR